MSFPVQSKRNTDFSSSFLPAIAGQFGSELRCRITSYCEATSHCVGGPDTRGLAQPGWTVVILNTALSDGQLKIRAMHMAYWEAMPKPCFPVCSRMMIRLRGKARSFGLEYGVALIACRAEP